MVYFWKNKIVGMLKDVTIFPWQEFGDLIHMIQGFEYIVIHYDTVSKSISSNFSPKEGNFCTASKFFFTLLFG